MKIFRAVAKFMRIFFMLVRVEDCLVRKIDPAKIEEAFEIEHQEFYGEPSEGKQIDRWIWEKVWSPFLQKMKPGDELWFYRLPDEFWEHMCGHQGYVIIRNGKKVAYERTVCN